jgi:hypothetical protein
MTAPTPSSLKLPRFKYTGDSKVLMTVDVDMDAELLIVGQPENGAYEWVIVNHDKVEQHSDCGYGQKSIALRDGLIAYHGLEPLQDALDALLRELNRNTDDGMYHSVAAEMAREALAKAEL